jgi:hypothetical protein
MWRTMLGAGIGGAVCLQIGACSALALGWLGSLGWPDTLTIAAVVGGVLGASGAMAGASAARAGSPLPLSDDLDPGQVADYDDSLPAS